MSELGRLYYYGMGIATNKCVGIILLYNARRRGSREAERILWRIGDDALLGAAVKADLENEVDIAIYILQPLAYQGNARAQFQLATIYDRLEGGRNIDRCVRLYAKAIKRGLSFAWNNLDLLLSAGLASWDQILEAME